ncbi:MAG: acyl-CoA dehydrogenase [Planctomycetia bacterium]|nr:acyl-CoA dehydrogenase [Planctomycetia bacterium]
MASCSDSAAHTALHAACTELASLAERSATEGPWASGAMRALTRSGVLARFLPTDCGGTADDEATLVETLAATATACLTTALALSQWAAAVRIIAAGPPDLRTTLLPALGRGETFTTVGISQLTTSRRHLGRPALAADRDAAGWRLDGVCPWVTGADACATIVTGGQAPDGRQIFFVVPTTAAGVTLEPPLAMLALSGSRTAVVRLAGVRPAHMIEPPGQNAPRTGGLATTALALGAARASIALVAAELERLFQRLTQAAREGLAAADRDRLRATATDLALRAGQAALTASKGAGFVQGHPAERLVRESLFFVVWSCPQAVADTLLCEMSGG